MKSKQKAFNREVVPQKKDIELSSLVQGQALNVLLKEIQAGSAIILLGSEFAPKLEYSKAIRLEMRKPTGNGIVTYDAYVPFKPQWNRDIVTVSLFDYGNKTIVHSIKRLGPLRSRTLYAADLEDENIANS